MAPHRRAAGGASSSTSTSRWILYGSYGFTGLLTAPLAVSRGMTPVLAGRNPDKVRKQAEELGIEEYLAFSLDDKKALDDALRDVFAIVVRSRGGGQACCGVVMTMTLSSPPPSFHPVLSIHHTPAVDGWTLLPDVTSCGGRVPEDQDPLHRHHWGD